MEWQNQEMQPEGEEEYLQYQIQNGVCGKVMTDEQMEELRKQIVAYAIISEQLAEMHKAMSAHQDFTGLSLFFFFCASNICFWFLFLGSFTSFVCYKCI